MNTRLLDQAQEALETALAALESYRAGLPPETAAPAPPVAPAPPAPPAPAVAGLRNPKAFYDALRAGALLGPTLSQDEVAGCEAILAACLGWPVSWAAYALATAYHETAHTLKPIKEIGGEAYYRRMYDIQGQRPAKARELGNLTPGDGAKYAGRGYVQLTGKANYARAGAKLGLPLVDNPDLAMVPDVAAQIMRQGLAEGWFTGKALTAYLPKTADVHQFTNARRTVNGQDRAVEIAAYALEFQSALKAGGWPQ